MSMSQAFLQEFDQEAKTTRRVLERVPAEKFSLEAASQIDVARRARDAHRDDAWHDLRLGLRGGNDNGQRREASGLHVHR